MTAEEQVDHHRQTLRDQGRLVLAFLSLPLLDAGIAFLVMLVIVPMLGRYGNPLDNAISMLLGIGLTSILVTGVLVLPIVLLFIRWGRISLTQMLVTGAMLGVAPFLLVITLAYVNISADPRASARDGYEMAVLGMSLGLVSAAAFWVIGIRGTRYAKDSTGHDSVNTASSGT